MGSAGGCPPPDTGREGPVGYKFPLVGTQETMGEAEAKRSPPHIPYLSQPFIKSKKTNVEVPEHGESRVWEGSERSGEGSNDNTPGRRKVPRGTKAGSLLGKL
jgi:hypothetical protein